MGKGMVKRAASYRTVQNFLEAEAERVKQQAESAGAEEGFVGLRTRSARAANATGGRPTETFVHLSSSPSPDGPRNSLRLHGRRHFNRGLFVIDLRHIPAGCGTKIKV